MDESRSCTNETNKELAGLFNSTQEMLAILTPEGRFHRVNHAWKQLLGRDLPELVQSSLTDLIHADDLWLVTQKIDFVGKQKNAATFTARCQDKDGNSRWLRWHLSPSPDQLWIYVEAFDVTDHVTANDELLKSNEMLTSVLLCAPVATWAVDMDGRVQFWNEAAEQTLGWTAEEVLRGAAPQFLPGSSVFDALAEDSFAGKEVLWHGKDGFPRVLRVWTAPLHDGTGLQCGTLGMSVDVTPAISLGPNSAGHRSEAKRREA